MRRALTSAVVLFIALVWAGAAFASASGVVISEFRFRGPVGGNDEYVELMNAGSGAVDISGWKLQGCSSTTGAASDRATVPAGVVLQAGEHYLFVNNNASGGYSGSVPGDRTYGTGFTDGAGARIVTAANAVVDGVSGTLTAASECREGAGIPGMPTANGDQSYERKLGGTQDTDNNLEDFVGPKAGNPQNHAAADQAPRVLTTDPADNAVGVPVDTNLQITFSEPVSVVGIWFSISCSTSGSHTATVAGGPTTFTLNPDSNFLPDETCTVTVTGTAVHDNDTSDPPDTMTADFVFHVSTPAPPLRIHDIQGAAHLSPRTGVNVSGVEGIVTLKTSNGFFMQDPNPDADLATSEGIFVFGSITAGLVAVGDLVHINGQVQEFRAGGASSTNLTITEIGNTSLGEIVSHGNPVPAPAVWNPPAQVIEDDATGNVETSGTFDPASDGIDYAESLEGMLVRIDDSTATGPSVNFTSSQTTEEIGRAHV